MADENEGLYLYCLSSASDIPQVLEPMGIGEPGTTVHTVNYDGIGMVVSRSPRIVFAELRPEQTIHHLATHQQVIEHVMRQSTVVPIKFGTYARNKAAARRILQDNHAKLKQTLASIHGKIELDVVVSWPELQAVLQKIAKEPSITELKAQIAALPPDQAFQRKIRLGALVKKRLDTYRKHLGEEILAALQGLVCDLSINTLKDDSMVLNVALLLDRSAEADLDAKVNELDERFKSALSFRCVGPLPPYSFATAEIQTIDTDLLDTARAVLQLPRAATFNEVRRSHRRLMREFHPDNSPADRSAPSLQEVGDAFKLIREYCHNVRHSFANGTCKGLAVLKIRKLSELRAAVTAAP